MNAHMDLNMRSIDYVKEASDYIETADGTKYLHLKCVKNFD